MRILITGMSGTGKSTALRELGKRGYDVVDTDTDLWSEWVVLPDGSSDWVWREVAMNRLLTEHRDVTLFVAGCKSNQGSFYPQFDEVVLLSAPAEILLQRISQRTDNPYGKSADELAASPTIWPPSNRCSDAPRPSRLTRPDRSTRSSSSLKRWAASPPGWRCRHTDRSTAARPWDRESSADRAR